jgi:hypothetical protein
MIFTNVMLMAVLVVLGYTIAGQFLLFKRIKETRVKLDRLCKLLNEKEPTMAAMFGIKEKGNGGGTGRNWGVPGRQDRPN